MGQGGVAISKSQQVGGSRVARKVEKPCKRCGVAIPGKPSRVAMASFCSARCQYAFRKETNPLWKRTCEICHGPLLSGERKQRWCSPRCVGQSRKTKRTRACNHCGSSYEYHPNGVIGLKFCSWRCRDGARAHRPALLTVSCTLCGASVKRTAAAVKRVTRTFCSRSCAAQYHRGENHPATRGDHDPNRGPKWRTIAASIRLRDAFSCRRCGLCETANGQKLSVDHVRPWRSFKNKDDANHPDNLVALCRVCHSFKTTTVEQRWLRGDVLAWKQWVASLHLPSAAKFGFYA